MSPEDAELSAAWQVWVVEGLLDGEPEASLVAALVAQGLESELAAAEVRRLAVAPATQVARRRLATAAGRRMVHELREGCRRVAPPHIERRAGLDAATVRDVYVAHGLPVVLSGWCAGWPAMRWTPASLAARLGDVEVSVCTGRESDPEPDRNLQQHTVPMRLGDYLEAIARPGVGNDLYMVAQHRNLDGPLAGLLDDLRPDPELVDLARLRGNVSLWIGPAGTRTASHHDGCHIVFCQLHGRKRVWLAPPDELRLAAPGRGYYARHELPEASLRAPGGPLEGAWVADVIVAPGDALLLPAGWWHAVQSLDVSISVSLVGLRFPNRYDAYLPSSVAG